jgi:capsular polysaccharide biosynthesis protein
MKKTDIKKWRNNRPTSMFAKSKRWVGNPVGALERCLEFAYFGQPMFNFFIGNSRDLEQIMHMSKSVNNINSHENLIVLDNVRVDLDENFIQLDTGHILNSRLAANAIFSGEHWSSIRNIRRSKAKNLQKGNFYPIANQKYFYHFLVEELPEIISANQSNLEVTFVTYEDQPKYVLELCKLAGIQLQFLERRIHLFERIIIPNYSRMNSEWSRDQLKSLKNRVEAGKFSARKLLLLRKGKVRSDQEFEEFLTSYLGQFGFEVMDPDKFTNNEQIDIFSNATEIVALHGAALSNLVFSNSECRIFEIFNHPYRMYVFRDLARINGNSYTCAEMNSVYTDLENWLSKPFIEKAKL